MKQTERSTAMAFLPCQPQLEEIEARIGLAITANLAGELMLTIPSRNEWRRDIRVSHLLHLRAASRMLHPATPRHRDHHGG